MLMHCSLQKYCTIGNGALKQCGMNLGIKEFGKSGVQEVLKDMLQLNDSNFLEPFEPKNLTHDNRRVALILLLFMNEKGDGMIKGGGWCDIRKHCNHMTKEETSSTAVSLEVLMLSCVIDEMEI